MFAVVEGHLWCELVILTGVLQAVRQDACRTITARLQAMFEAMSQGGVVAEQLPVRVSVSLPTCRQFLLADYLLPQEDLQVERCVTYW